MVQSFLENSLAFPQKSYMSHNSIDGHIPKRNANAGTKLLHKHLKQH